MRKIFFLFIAVFAISSCRFSLDKLDEKNLEEGGFTEHLAIKYREYSRFQADKRDWGDAAVFAKKGLRAAGGIPIEPEHPEDWDIRESSLPILRMARREMLDVVNGDVINKFPDEAAEAYLLFDCWVEEEENWWRDQTQRCRRDFFELINNISIMSADLEIAEKEAAEAAAEAAGISESEEMAPEIEEAQSMGDESNELEEMVEMEEAIEDEEGLLYTSYVVFFGANSSDVGAEGGSIVEEVAQVLKGKNDYEIVLNGHTDKLEGKDDRMALSMDRASAVRDAFVKNGVKSANIRIYGFGDTDNAKPTDEGVDEQVNRRVEIFIQ